MTLLFVRRTVYEMIDGTGTASRTAANGNRSSERTGALVETLLERAARPLEEAQAMPGAFYADPDLYALELERIFHSDWVYVGRAEQVAQPGDWLSADIGSQPVLLLRGKDGQLRAFSRICPHRFADLLAGAEADHGHCEGLVCPYHSWAFDSEGALVGAPLMDESALFARDRDRYRLRQFRVETWHGFVFVSLDPDVPDLAERLADAEHLVAQYGLDDFRYVGRVAWPETEANWKLVMDNGRECYHHQGLHTETVEPLWPSRLVELEATDSRFWFAQRMYVAPEAAVGEEHGHLLHPLALPPVGGLNAHERSYTLLMGVYPNMFLSPGPDFCAIGRWFPTGPTTHVFEIGYAIHKDNLDHPGLDQILEQVHEWIAAIQAEDSRIVTSIQQMASSGHASEGGALSHLERPVWQFQKYLAHRLGGSV